MAILHESTNFYVVKDGRKFQVCMSGATHAVVVGTASTAEVAIRTAVKLENHPQSVRRAFNHY